MMNKFVLLLLLGLFFLSGTALAYQINIDTPDTLSVGRPLIVNGTTNFGIGTPIDVVLYHQVTTNTEVKRKIAYVQSDHTFRVVFDTTNLEKGTYKVEVPASGLGESINAKIVELVDRTDEVRLSSPQQEYSGILLIAGTLQGNKNAGVQIEVSGPDGERVFGPQYIGTSSQGAFSTEIQIDGGGEYEVSFTDSDGFIGTKTIMVAGEVTQIGAVPAATTAATRLSAHAKASRENPAYFEVKPGSGPVNVYTSSQVDWVIEYVDDRGVLHSVNDRGELNPEEITIDSGGKTLYFRIYPYKYTETRDVFLYAENARSVKVSTTVPAVLGTGKGGTQFPGETQSPFYPVLAFLALLVVLAFRSRS